jgi:hypothetical protein
VKKPKSPKNSNIRRHAQIKKKMTKSSSKQNENTPLKQLKGEN